MGTETRIGIVTGLIIVVVASVYFFYGNETTEKDFLVSADTTASVPPKIPISADTKRVKPAPRTRSQSGRQRPTAPRASGPGKELAFGHGSRKHSQPAGGRVHSPKRPPVQMRGELAVNGARNGKSPTYLRTSPADELRKATQENVKGQGSATTPGNRPTVSGEGFAGNTGVRQANRDKSRRPGTGFTPRAQLDRPKTRAPIARPRRHTVASGDTLSDISSQYYGNSGKVQQILAANPGVKNPHAIAIGDVLVIPAIEGNAPSARSIPTARNGQTETPVRDAPRPAQRTYRVRSGDTFYGIARRVYGDGTRWKEIYRANKTLIGNDPKRLKPGMVLKLPK